MALISCAVTAQLICAFVFLCMQMQVAHAGFSKQGGSRPCAPATPALCAAYFFDKKKNRIELTLNETSGNSLKCKALLMKQLHIFSFLFPGCY